MTCANEGVKQLSFDRNIRILGNVFLVFGFIVFIISLIFLINGWPFKTMSNGAHKIDELLVSFCYLIMGSVVIMCGLGIRNISRDVHDFFQMNANKHGYLSSDFTEINFVLVMSILFLLSINGVFILEKGAQIDSPLLLLLLTCAVVTGYYTIVFKYKKETCNKS
jgi:hypothetical protein